MKLIYINYNKINKNDIHILKYEKYENNIFDNRRKINKNDIY